MRKSLAGVLIVVIMSVFISACSINNSQVNDAVSSAEQTSTINGDKFNTVKGETDSEETTFDDNRYDDDPRLIHYNDKDYMGGSNAWRYKDENWLNENYTYIGYAEYMDCRSGDKMGGNYTTIIGGCKIYRCNDEDTFIFTLWGDGSIYLFAQCDLTDEELVAASAATDWKN